jgi:hypothetical protein
MSPETLGDVVYSNWDTLVNAECNQEVADGHNDPVRVVLQRHSNQSEADGVQSEGQPHDVQSVLGFPGAKELSQAGAVEDRKTRKQKRKKKKPSEERSERNIERGKRGERDKGKNRKAQN